MARKLGQEKLKTYAESIIHRVEKTYESLKSIKGFKGVFKVAPTVVKHVKDLGDTLGLAGSQKKEVAVEVILQLLEGKLPWWAPRWLVGMIISHAIEVAYREMKKRFGKK